MSIRKTGCYAHETLTLGCSLRNVWTQLGKKLEIVSSDAGGSFLLLFKAANRKKTMLLKHSHYSASLIFYLSE